MKQVGTPDYLLCEFVTCKLVKCTHDKHQKIMQCNIFMATLNSATVCCHDDTFQRFPRRREKRTISETELGIVSSND